MSRINTNISSLQAMNTLAKNQSSLSTSLQRLSTGLKINSGKDAPAGLIASETLRSEINGINQAIDNSTRAGNVINTAEGALNEVSSLLLEVQSLTNEAANKGALSDEEIKANQLQVDAILNSINRISNTTQFNGVKLLDGTLDYSTSNVVASQLGAVQINGATLPDNGSVNITVQVSASAKTGQVTWYATPTAHARARRMEIDQNDNITFTEYRGNKVAVFDPKTEHFTEYPLPAGTYPYRANFDHNGDIWASTMSTDRVVRLHPKTGQAEQIETLQP